METPEKIYIKDFGDKLSFGYYTKQFDGFDIEYTRTDVFIEKAKKWFEETLKDTDFYEDEIELLIKEFKKAMKL